MHSILMHLKILNNIINDFENKMGLAEYFIGVLGIFLI
jgi:hypothetical protein